MNDPNNDYAVGPRVWASPYFNATRERCYGMQEELGVKIAGEQKLTPFPHWTLSTEVGGPHYSFLSEPVSDWFVEGAVAQSLDQFYNMEPHVHSFLTLRNAVDSYYSLGALINIYSHTTTSGYSPYSD